MEGHLFEAMMIYLATGAVVGVLAGLFGVGGGLLVVPVLTTVFAWTLGEAPYLVHLAIGTSLATILLTSLASVRAHHHHGAVDWALVRQLAGGMFVGAFLGGWSSQFIPERELAWIFATIETVIALYLLAAVAPQPHRQLPGSLGNVIAGGGIGFIASLVGIGGGALVTPYLVWHNIPMHTAIATAAACSLPVAAAGTLGFLLGGMNTPGLPDYATGYIYWPAFIGIVLTSTLTAKWGAKLAHRLPAQLLKRAFGLLLLGLAIKMVIWG